MRKTLMKMPVISSPPVESRKYLTMPLRATSLSLKSTELPTIFSCHLITSPNYVLKIVFGIFERELSFSPRGSPIQAKLSAYPRNNLGHRHCEYPGDQFQQKSIRLPWNCLDTGDQMSVVGWLQAKDRCRTAGRTLELTYTRAAFQFGGTLRYKILFDCSDVALPTICEVSKCLSVYYDIA